MAASNQDDDGEMLRAMAQGSAEALGHFYERYEPLVAGYLMRRCGDPELSADLTAETFAAAALSASRVRDEGQGAAGWLLGIARHGLSRSLRRGAVERRARERLKVEITVTAPESLDRLEALLDADDPANPYLIALGRLPVAQREAIHAHVLMDEPYAEVAHRLGVSEATVRQRVSRGLARLRTTLQEGSA